jgi:beta-galactosidase
MFRGLTGRQKPFMVAETGAFSFDAAAAESYDLVKPWFWLAVAHGAESYVYFRWRESVSGEETHPAILPWSGRRTFVYDMVKRQMDEFRSLPDSIARLPLPRAEVAIVHDADSHSYSLAWAVGLKQQDVLMAAGRRLNAALEGRGVWTDFVQLSDDMDLSMYKVVFFPQCYSLSRAQQSKIRAYVESGGAAVAVNRMNFCSPLGGRYYPETCPVGMTDLFGVEIDERRDVPSGNVELAEAVDAEVVMRLEDTCFRGRPLLARRAAGKGAAYYYTRVPDLDMARALVAEVLGREGVAMREPLPDGVSRVERGRYVVVVNFSKSEADLPAEDGEVLLGSPAVSGGRMRVKPFDVVVCRR